MTRTHPNLIWMPRIPRGEDFQLDLDSRADFPELSAPLNSEQDQHIDDLHPLSPPHPLQLSSPVVPKHPAVPQDHLDLDLSGLSLRFLRGSGPDISLDDILGSNATDDGSSSSSYASSAQVEDCAHFAAVQNRCANMLIFNRKDLPDDIFVRVTAGLEIVPWKPVKDILAPSGKEIVPWKPTGAALALQLFAVSMEQQSTDDQDQQGSHQSSATTFSHGFEFEVQTSRPNPITRVYKRRPKPKKATLSLPTTASVSNPTMPVVDMVNRRSQRLSAKKAGFSYRLDKNPSKKRKITALQISSINGEEGPVAIATLQSWGVQCGVDPGDLTEEALLQAPAEGNHP
jgi:hypothetical protein